MYFAPDKGFRLAQNYCSSAWESQTLPHPPVGHNLSIIGNTMKPPCPDSLVPPSAQQQSGQSWTIKLALRASRLGYELVFCAGVNYIACNTALMGGGEGPGMVWCQVFLSYKGNFVVMGNPWPPWHPDKVYKVQSAHGC